ncbi:MAG: DUF4139 domain-containing protein [Hyphomicrobiaceae bacterium]
MRLVASLAALLLSTASAFAAEIAATSRIDAVTVFPASAEVVRLAKVRIEAGEHTVRLIDLPEQAVPGSIRVEGAGSQAFVIGTVDTRRVVVPLEPPREMPAGERERIEREIERLTDAQEDREARLAVLLAKRGLLLQSAKLPDGVPVDKQPTFVASEEIARRLALLDGNLVSIEDNMLALRRQGRAEATQITNLRAQLRAVPPKQAMRTEVKVAVAATTAVEAELTVRYTVDEARWQPAYDARLTTGTGAATPALTLERRAAITQTTGESWEDAQLSLSTTRPTAGTAAPYLTAWMLDLRSRETVGQFSDVETGLKKRVTDEGNYGSRLPGLVVPAAPAPKVVADVAPVVIESGAYQALFRVPGRHTVLNVAEAKRVVIGSEKIDAELMARAVPKRDPRAFLYAKLKLSKGAPYLAGPVSLYRDNAFVGNGALPQLAGGEEHELGFGADDAIRIRYVALERRRGDSGVIFSSSNDERRFRITLKSHHERPIALTVLDQVPVAANTEIKVEPTFSVAPSRQDVEDRKGVIAWDLKLALGEERNIDLGYKITWPAGKAMLGGH